MSAPESTAPLTIGGVEIEPGQRRDLEIRVARLATGTWVALPIAVIRGRRAGPSVWLSAAVHGDELNGVEIVRQVLRRLEPRKLSGTLIAAPIVNVFGFLQQSRYLPDRRDLNRSFPGSPRGSLAARLANLFMREVVEHCRYGIDLHTGSHFRSNLPQLRADLEDPETRRLAIAFGAPVMIDARMRDGSLREAAIKRGCRVLVYEAGEALRFDRRSIRGGLRGVLRVLSTLRMIEDRPESDSSPSRAASTEWVRARRGGILVLEAELGETVGKGQVLAVITDTFSDKGKELRAPFGGLVIGVTTNPLVNRGDAVVHLANLEG